MKNVLTACCMAAACAVALSAQQSSDTKKQSGPDQWTKPFTVTGCLRVGLTAGTFELTDVKSLPAEARGATTTTGTSGTSGSSASTTTDAAAKDKTVTLIPEGTVDLTSQIGHEVSVTGRMPKKDNRHISEGGGVDQQSSGGAVNAGGQPSGVSTMSSGQGIGGGDVRAVSVSAVSQVSSSCSGEK